MGNLENGLRFMLTIIFGKTVPLPGEVSYFLPETAKDTVLYSTIQTGCNTKYKHKTGFDTKQQRQRTYYVTLRRVRATIVAGEKQLLLHIPRVCLFFFF